MKRLFITSAFTSLLLLSAQAQTYEYLDVNQIRARIDADAFPFRTTSEGRGYIVKTMNIPTIDYITIWISAERLSDGTIYADKDHFLAPDFMPGPMRLDRTANDSSVSAAWNRVFAVSRQDIDLFRQQFALGNVQNGTFPVPPSIADWPGNGPLGYSPQLAPYIDVNGDFQYNPLDGDFPKIKGDQAIWRVLNDISTNFRLMNDAEAPGLELQQMFYAVKDSNALGDDSLINYTTFVEYRIINRSLNDYVNFDIGLSGNYFPNGISYTRYQGTCVYNNAIYTFGLPHQIATADRKMTQSLMLVSDGNFVHTKSYYGTLLGTPAEGAPDTYHEVHNMLNGKWRDGSDMVYLLKGMADSINCPPGLPAKYYMPAGSDPTHIGTGGIDPGFNWQFNKTGCQNPQVINYISRTYAVIGDKTLNAGDELSFDIAYITQFNNATDDSAGIENLLTTICQKMDPVKDYYNNVIVPDYETFGTESFSGAASLKVYPNPSATEIFLETDIEKPFRVQIMNISGQTLKSISGYSNKTAIDISALAPGFYILKAGDGSSNHSIKFIKIRE